MKAYDVYQLSTSSTIADNWEDLLVKEQYIPLWKENLNEYLGNDVHIFMQKCQKLKISPKTLFNDISATNKITPILNLIVDNDFSKDVIYKLINIVNGIFNLEDLIELIKLKSLVPKKNIYRYDEHSGTNGIIYTFYIKNDTQPIDLRLHTHFNAVNNSIVDRVVFKYKNNVYNTSKVDKQKLKNVLGNLWGI